jgi:hypothetical protein
MAATFNNGQSLGTIRGILNANSEEVNTLRNDTADDRAAAEAAAVAAAADRVLAQTAATEAVAATATTAADVVLTHADVVAAEAARDAAIAGSILTFPTTAAGIGSGIAGVTSIVAGSAGTNGTFALAYSSGTQVLAPVGVFVVAGGVLVSVTITYPGYYSAGTPTLSFAASAGLTGASATAVMAANTPVNGFFAVPSAVSGEAAIIYKNVAGVATEAFRTPSTALVQLVIDRMPLTAPVGYAWSVYDGLDFAAVGVLDDGTFAANTADITALSTDGLIIASTTMLDAEYVGYAVVLGADASGNAAVGIKDDGTLAAIAMETVTLNGLPVPVPANRFGGAYPYQIGFINNTGESLAEGSTGTAITTAQEYDNICWPARTSTGGVFLASTVANGQYAARGENPMFGTQAGWKQAIRDENGLSYQTNDFRLLACNNGYSGYKIAQISKGQAPFTAMMAQATALQAYGVATGDTVGWLCNVLTIGANDGDPGSLTPTATFKTETLTLASDLDTDVRAIITSQTRRVLTIINQISSRAPQLAVAQLECCQESPLIVVAGPMYQYTYYDALHINPASERAMGALCGLVAKRVITDGVRWDALQPLSHIQVGASIYLRMNRSGLTFDTTTLPAQTRFGFDCLDGSAAAVSQSADPAIVGRDTIKLTFASEAVASTVAKIRAGHNASTGRADSFVGGSTNLRATNSLITFDALPVYDWCAIFNYSI